MEDLFDILLVVIIAIIGGVAKSKQNKKKKSSDRPMPTQMVEPITEPARPITDERKMASRRNIENAVKAFSELLDAEGTPKQPAVEPAEAAPKPAKAKRKKKPRSGESPVDDHGCIGGSMPVHQAEGESLAEHAQHERRSQEQQDAYALRVETLRRPSARELRKAIVMSEVLDKPVSLRRR